MNDAGHVVGTMSGVVGPDRAIAPFLYLGDPSGEVLDFQTLLDPASTRGWVCCNLSDINNAGQIVGSALGPDNVSHAVLLTPIPEPETFALMLAGPGRSA